METDPAQWTLADVQNFFRQDAARNITDRSGAQLPQLEPFLQALATNDVDGASLLDSVNLEGLKTDFGINSIRIRGTIIHCIKKLQARSLTHRSLTLRPETPASLSYVPRLAIGPETPVEVVQSVEAEAGENVRSGEYQLQDTHGRKRRKLDLTKAQPEAADVAPPSLPKVKMREDLTGFMPDGATLVDELFFGPTSFGNVIRDLPPSGNVLAGEAAEDANVDDNFQFTAHGKLLAETEFVHARMRHFLSNAETLDLRRKDRLAIAVLPYPDRVGSKQRSALVVHVGKDDEEYNATREQASLLQSGYDLSELEKGSTGDGEWDFLLQRHKHDNEDEELPLWGASTGELSITDSEFATRDGDDQEASEGDDEVLGEIHIARVVDEYVAVRIAEWQEKTLPRLEDKKAWTVWKKTKGSNLLREMLINSAKAKIKMLSERLSKYKNDFAGREWSSDTVITKVCAVLDPTINDLEEEEWNISVWQRRKEPAHVIHTSKKAGHAAQHPPSGNAAGPSFTVHPDDRMSVSPTPAGRMEAEDGEVFHTPAGSPAPSAGADMDGFEASDEMSLELAQRDESDSERSDDKADDSDALEEQDDKVPADAEVENEDDMVLENEDDVVHVTSSSPRLSSPSGSVSKFADRMRSLRPASPGSGQSAHSEDELPSPSSFVPKKHVKHLETPTKNRPGLSTQLIDLTGMSSDSPGPSSSRSKKPTKLSSSAKKAQKAQASVFRGKPEDAIAAEVQAWSHDELRVNSDKQRVLIKMLHYYGADLRNELHRMLSEDSQQFRERLSAAIRRCQEGVDGNTIMDDCAAIATAWFTADCDIMEKKQTAPWDAILNDPKHSAFIGVLRHYLKLRDSNLFVAPTPKKKQSKPNHSSITVLSSAESETERDNAHTLPSPRKRRKHKVHASEAAVKTRLNAHSRQQKYREALESQQGIGSSQFAAALDGSAVSLSEVAINPLQVEAGKPAIFINKRIATKMKPHQVEGVRFMWREVSSADDNEPQGCLLAHTMGLGKTMQSIALLVALVEVSESKDRTVRHQLPKRLRPKAVQGDDRERQLRMLILCPPGLVQNWQKELGQWAPKRLRNVFIVEASGKTDATGVVENWFNAGGVLLIGYGMLRILIGRESKAQEEAGSEEPGSTSKMLLQGPEVVIADEAHNLKNPKAKVSQVASQFETHTRIALTGTPMSNDVDEIYALVSWVAPDFLGDHTWFKANFAEPIKEGTYNDSSRSEKRKSLMKLQVLHNDIAPKVNRADITALRGSLSSKTEFVITVTLTETQKTLYKRVIAALLGGGKNKEASEVRIFSWLGVLMLLTNHPDAFRRKLLTPAPPKKRSSTTAVEDESDAASGAASAATSVALDTIAEQAIAAEAPTKDPGDEDLFALGFTQGMVDTILEGYGEDTDPQLSAKMPVFLSILNLSFCIGDKVLVFSGSIPTMNYVGEMFKREGIPYGRIDGQTVPRKRMEIIKNFQDDRFEVLIVSTRAGGVGLNIQCANRVVILDFSFNPTWEEQAIGRAYRLGQKKPVFVYRFWAGGTFETNIYNKQAFKKSLTQRVVDKKNPRRTAERNTREYLYDPLPVLQVDIAAQIGKDPDVLDAILQDQIEGADRLIRSIQTTEVLEADAEDEPLDEEEKRLVEQEIQLGRTKLRGRIVADVVPPSTAVYAAMAAAGGGVLTGRLMGPPAATQAPTRPAPPNGLPRARPSSTAPSV